MTSDPKIEMSGNNGSVPESNTTNNISRAQDDEDSFEEDKDFNSDDDGEFSSIYVPKTAEQVNETVQGTIGGILRKQTTLANMAKKKNVSKLEKEVLLHMA